MMQRSEQYLLHLQLAFPQKKKLREGWIQWIHHQELVRIHRDGLG